jgi:hypothetical protein
MTSGVLGAVTPIGAADASDAPSSKRTSAFAPARGEDRDGRGTTSRKETR